MQRKSPSHSARAAVVAASLVLAAALPSPSRAQFIVNDPVHQMQNILTQLQGIAKDTVEYAEQASRWYQTYSHYQQQLVRMGGVVRSFSLPAGQAMETVDSDYRVEERCGGGGAGGLGGALQGKVLERSGDYVAQQRDICRQLQRIHNLKYNDTVRFLKETLPRMQAAVKQVEQQRAADNSNGTVDGTSNASLKLLTDFGAQMQEWNARMQGYDALVVTLQESQRTLARLALKGHESTVGAAVRTGVLQGALRVGN